MDIDFVITWVDMNDPVWQEKFNRYRNDKHN
ncbi:MAG: Stealth CR1 domain-containing protein, partial [Muribaculaceae bacterium]